MSTKGCVEFFVFYLDFELFAKIKKDLVSTHSFVTLLLITQDLNKTSPVKVFKFSDKKPGFLEIREVCLNLGIGFCILDLHKLIITTK